MKLLIDTCVLLWMSREQAQLSTHAQEALADADAQLFISAICAFEIAVKAKKGKLTLPKPPIEWFAAALRLFRIAEIPVSSGIAAGSCDVAVPHADPCDRIIIATARINGMPIVTSDRLIQMCPDVRVLW